MKLLFPNNIFSKILAQSLPAEFRSEVSFVPASTISRSIEEGSADMGLIPSLDLIKHPQFFVSGRIAVSFDGSLSNSYLYFQPDKEDLKDIYFAGDVTVNEILLSKILFKERYSIDIEAHLETEQVRISEKNYLLTGDINLRDDMLQNQFSLSDEVSNMLEQPYVNFIMASKTEDNVEKLNARVDNLDNLIDDKLEDFIATFKLGENTHEFIMNNINSVYYEITESEQEGLMELLRLPYYNGTMDEMIEIKLI